MNDDRHGSFDLLNVRGLAAKREYVRGLEQRRDPEALTRLVECLCDESWYLRSLAEEALLRLGDPGAAALVPWLEQGLWFTRTSAARIVGRLAHAPALPALLRLADDENRTVAEAARAAVIAIARASGAAAVTSAIRSLPAEIRRRRLDEIALADPVTHGRVAPRAGAGRSADPVHDDRASGEDEGIAWDVLTGPSGSRGARGWTDAPDGDAGRPI